MSNADAAKGIKYPLKQEPTKITRLEVNDLVMENRPRNLQRRRSYTSYIYYIYAQTYLRHICIFLEKKVSTSTISAYTQ